MSRSEQSESGKLRFEGVCSIDTAISSSASARAVMSVSRTSTREGRGRGARRRRAWQVGGVVLAGAVVLAVVGLGAREQAATLVEDARTALGAAEADKTRVRAELDAWVAEHPGL